jgi:hypothetical protein
LQSQRGQDLLKSIPGRRNEFQQRFRNEIGRDPPPARSNDMDGVDRFIDDQSRDSRDGNLRSVVLAGLPGVLPGFSEGQSAEAKADVATLFRDVLKTACYQGLTVEAFNDRLNSFAN